MKKYSFLEPDDKYRGLDLWMVNDDLDDDEIRRQVREFRDKGLYSVVFRTYNGLISDYPGPRFKSKVRVAIEEAKACGLKIALQAGYMPSAYPDLPKQNALHRIVPIKVEALTSEDTVIAEHEGIAFVDRIAPATVNMLDGESVDYYIRTAYEENWEEFSDEYGKTVISVWLDEPRFDNRYLTWTPDFEERFFARFGYSIKATLPSLYYDVGDFKRVRYDYFRFLRESMENCYYTKVREWCHAHGLSFAGHLMGEERLTMQIAQASAVMPFYKYFDVPGIDMLSAVHDWYDKPLVPYTEVKRRFRERSMHVAAIQLASAAEQAGRELKLCEMYGVTSPSFAFRDMLHLFDFFAANGINHQCVHALFYSPRGFRKRFYPQSFNRYMPYWESFRDVKDHVAAVSSFVSSGRCATDIAVLHPLETASGYFRGLTNPTDESPRAAVDDYDERYYRLIVQLYSNQCGFHFVDPSTLDSLGSASDSLLKVGEMSYKALVIADIEVLSRKTLEIIRGFAECGGRVYIKGAPPTRIDGVYTPELAEELAALPGATVLEDNESLIRALRRREGQRYRYICDSDPSKTVINHRADGESNYFFIHNGDCRREKRGRIILRGEHTAYIFDARAGRISEIGVEYEDGATVIPVANAIGGSVMIFTERGRSVSKIKRSGARLTLAPRSAECIASDENLLTLELCTYKTEGSENFTDREIAVERVTERLKRENYRGDITLRFSFESDFEAKGLRLVLEDSAECEVTLNGVKVDTEVIGHYYTPAFEIIKLPDAVLRGKNYIEVKRYTEPPLATNPSDDMKHLFELFRMPEGVDLERIHLLGNFRVDTVAEYSQAAGLVRVARNFRLAEPSAIRDSEDLTSCGYPFYPGAVRYKIRFDIDESIADLEAAALRIGRYNGFTASVTVNGEPAGSIDREPYTLDIRRDALRVGENEVEIRLLGSFRNMFGPSHLLGYDATECARPVWYDSYKSTDCTEYDVGTLTNSFQLAPYGLGDFSLELYR